MYVSVRKRTCACAYVHERARTDTHTTRRTAAIEIAADGFLLLAKYTDSKGYSAAHFSRRPKRTHVICIASMLQ